MHSKILKKCTAKSLKLAHLNKMCYYFGGDDYMNYDDNKYLPRLADEKLEKYLKVFGAVSVEGPKWCGKTWTSSRFSNSSIFLDNDETFERASLSLDMVLNESSPELVDEWTKIPKIWDSIRRRCDETEKKGNYILTCSTELSEKRKKEVFHSGAGRIGKLKMYPMSLYESKVSTCEASIMDMFNGVQENKSVKTPSLFDIASLIVRGGWPSNISVDDEFIDLIPNSYIEAILDKDINDEKKRDKNKMRMLLKSLARNESTVVSNQTLLKDIEDYSNNEEFLESRNTLSDYLDVLTRLYVIENQESYSENYRSPERIGKSPKRHFIDPSLACAVLELNSEKLIDDLNTFGFMFESLVERDLKIYMDYLGGHLYHFRDNTNGLEVDSILEFKGGDYAAVEIKLGNNKIEEAKATLLSFESNMVKKPKFMCIITANSTYVGRDKETGIYILPITALRP